MVGDATWAGWSEGQGIVEKASDFYLLIRSAGGHVPEHRLRIDEALDAVSRTGVELPTLWRTPAALLENIRAETARLGKQARAKLRQGLGISRIHLWRIAAGKRVPSFPVLCRWAYLIGRPLHLRRPAPGREPLEPDDPSPDGEPAPALRCEPPDDEMAEGDTPPDDEPRDCDPAPDHAAEPVQRPAEVDKTAMDPAVAGPNVARPTQFDRCEAQDTAVASDNVSKPVQDSAFDPQNVTNPARIDAFDSRAVTSDPRAVTQPDRHNATASAPRNRPASPISASPNARIKSPRKKRRSSLTITSSPLSSSPMPLEFRRRSKVVGTLDPGVTDPDELKRIAFEALRAGIAPADSTPYINGQPLDMTVYHLERRIAEEAKRREEAIAALEQRVMAAMAEKFAEVLKEIEGLKEFTRDTVAAVGAEHHQLRDEFRATVQRLIETPAMFSEALRELLRMAGGQQGAKDDKKEKDHGN